MLLRHLGQVKLGTASRYAAKSCAPNLSSAKPVEPVFIRTSASLMGTACSRLFVTVPTQPCTSGFGSFSQNALFFAPSEVRFELLGMQNTQDLQQSKK
jgi:hypothetical protein